MAFGITGGEALMAGVGLLGGYMSSSAAGDASSAQAAAAAQSDATQRYQYDTTRADNAPFRQTGLDANNRLATLMGIGGNNEYVGVGAFDANGGRPAVENPEYGSLTRNFTTADMNSDPVLNAAPGYMAPMHNFGQADLNKDLVYQNGLQFGLDQGAQGINRQAAAGGNFLSGATLKALTRFGNDYGTTKAAGAYDRFNTNQNTQYGQRVDSFNRFNTDQNQQYNRLAGLSGAGQQATNQVNAAGQNMANNISASQQGAGNAQAAGIVGGANAWNSALGQGVNAYQQNNLLSALGNGTGYSGNTGYSGSTGYSAGADPLGGMISANGW